jgi:hypothetical protein
MNKLLVGVPLIQTLVSTVTTHLLSLQIHALEIYFRQYGHQIQSYWVWCGWSFN